MKAGAAFFLALILAVGAAVGVFEYVNGVRQHNQRPAEQVAVIVSNVNIQPNTTLDPLISAGDFATLNVPTAAVVTGAVTDINQLRAQTTSQFIVAGEQIPTARLRGSEVQSGGPLHNPPRGPARTNAPGPPPPGEGPRSTRHPPGL